MQRKHIISVIFGFTALVAAGISMADGPAASETKAVIKHTAEKDMGLAAVLFLAGCAPQNVPLAGPILDNLSGERSREERRRYRPAIAAHRTKQHRHGHRASTIRPPSFLP
jgi:hypothetical protein